MLCLETWKVVVRLLEVPAALLSAARVWLGLPAS